MKYGTRTDIGKIREINEDAYIANGTIFAVADGMGGHNAGEIASSLALKTLAKNIFLEKELKKNLFSSIKKANKAVYLESLSSPKKRGMGTTLTVFVPKNDKAYIGHIGDSRIYLLRNLELMQSTEDHSLVAQMIKEGRLTTKEARFHPLRNVITRALGDKTIVQPDVSTLTIKPGDKILLATDGLTSMLTDAEIQKILIQNLEPQNLCDLLIEEANKKGGFDNITVVLAEFDKDDFTPPNSSSVKEQKSLKKVPFLLGAFFVVLVLVFFYTILRK
ncbi:Stp1/IreP family PP2C-type Ser/Thr phosphatase [Candidatus Oleimmundimicrobium sp.]|uniref:Stp1/IreP family PP2C-type Ser/Thr phosphatase n=1 Tax=Candidatus Oleimmundimicrobium sp. TaxID=3060597 RepID=UPI00271591CB|nr:Stp1/IreP family PP2C-type Ser/Thr phosphatase [Candidatus Oleimmundimicrobium sp.]MDO8886813.1 Stp1/IreP family PP2C-type Ser/Thr phosphatase [Candidatus Oleimmundimicrobium sp.]